MRSRSNIYRVKMAYGGVCGCLCHTLPVNSPDKVWVSPPGWQFWKPAGVTQAPAPSRQPLSRRDLALETWFVQLAFLAPAVLAAVDLLASRVGGGSAITRFPSYVANPALNLALGILTYLASVGVTVPLALLLLSRTGQRPATLGLTVPRWRADVWPGLGLLLACYGAALATTLLLEGLVGRNSKLLVEVPVGHVPAYYVIYGIAISAVTAVAEETLVNGYLLTRLEQLGWNPRRALVLSLILRTSYHVYYGLGFLLTIPFGYLLTRSFQKHRRLTRPILVHFLYDSVLLSIAILVSH
jgi:membrane protease YdiL (CAAX protease family)